MLSRFFWIFLFFSSLNLKADDTIFVTADRMKSSQESSPSKVTVFEEADLQKASSISDLLASTSDLHLAQSGPFGSQSSLFLRGSDATHTLVILDGIVMNDPSAPGRQFDFGRLSLNSIERIEILKGSQGLLYGSNAVGGVILITSKKALQKKELSASLGYGSLNTLESGLNFRQRLSSTSLSVGLEHFKSEGFSAAHSTQNPNADKDGEKRSTINLSASHSLTTVDELLAQYRYVHDRTELDKGGGPGNDDPNDYQRTEQQFIKAGYTHLWAEAETQLSLTRTLHQRSSHEIKDSAHPEESFRRSLGKLDTFNLNHTHYTAPWLTQNVNFEYQRERDQSKNANENISSFFYNRLEKNKDVLHLGVRLDHNHIFNDHFTYKAAYLHDFDLLQTKMSYSTGFLAPSLSQLFDPTYGNRSLTPEKSQSGEVGVDVPFSSRHKYSGSLFFTDLNQRLTYDPITYVNKNGGRARIIGTEHDVKVKVSSKAETHLSLTWLSARDLTLRKKLLRRPNLSAKGSINYRWEQHALDLEANYTGKRPDVDYLQRDVNMPSHTVFNLTYNYEASSHLRLFLKIKNLLDKEYEDISGFGSGGRMVSLGLHYTL